MTCHICEFYIHQHYVQHSLHVIVSAIIDVNADLLSTLNNQMSFRSRSRSLSADPDRISSAVTMFTTTVKISKPAFRLAYKVKYQNTQSKYFALNRINVGSKDLRFILIQSITSWFILNVSLITHDCTKLTI